MMFQSLQSLLAGGTLTLAITANKDGTITVLTVPTGEGALSQPLALTATAAELDAQFADAIGTFSASRKSLVEQMETTAAVIAAAKQESAGKAVKALTKSAPDGKVIDKGNASEPDLEEDDDGNGNIKPSSPTPAEPALASGNLFA